MRKISFIIIFAVLFILFTGTAALHADNDTEKTDLNRLINKADSILSQIPEGQGEGQAPAKARNKLINAVGASKSVSADTKASADQLNKSIKKLDDAIITFLKNINIKKPLKLEKFNNPLYQGQDPFVMYKDGYYYFVSSSNLDSNNKIYVSKSRSLIDQGEKITVFDSKGKQTRIFAPEIFFIEGKWYIYYCADYADHGFKHLAGVLEAKTDDPQGEYIDKGPLFTGENGVNQQANDFTVFEWKGQLYGVWGTMPEQPVSPGAPAIVKMDSPTQITQNRSFLPKYGGEGPRVLMNGDSLYITVSHGGFAQKNYHLAAYIYKGTGDLLDPSSWKFQAGVFKGTKDVYGAGRASFVKSADGKEDFMMYHSKVYEAEDNGWRQVNIQKFIWSEDGKPQFGKPVSPYVFQDLPSGDPGIGDIYQAEDALIFGGVQKDNKNRGHQGTGYVVIDSMKNSEITFIVDVPESDYYFIRSRYSYGVKAPGEYTSFPNTQLPKRGSLSVFVNGSRVKAMAFDKTDITWETWFYAGEVFKLDKGKNVITFKVDNGDTGNINIDYIAVDKANERTRDDDSVRNTSLLPFILVPIIIIIIVGAVIIIVRRKR